jgi:tetratricopeptide (TPR) repeat protein
VATGLVLLVLNVPRTRGPQTQSRLLGLSRPSLSIGVLPVRAASARGELDWVAQGLANQLPAALTAVAGLDVRPSESFTPLIGQLDSVALARGINYFVRAAVTRGARDTVVVTLELIEEGVRLARAGDVRAPLDSQATVDRLTSQIVETLRPMLGGRIRERQLEAGTTSAVALQQRYRADHHRAVLRERLARGDINGAEAALDLAEASLVASEQADPTWLAPRVGRAALSGTRTLLVLFRPGPTDHGAIRRVYDQGIAVLDSALALNPDDPAALAMRGRLRWERVLLGEEYPLGATAMIDAAEKDLRAALSGDTTLAHAAADLSQLLFEARGRYDEAAQLAERAYRLDAYMEKTSEILDRLALSRLETGDDAEALRWCAEGLRRFPENPAHRGCFLEVLAWGAKAGSPDSARMHYDAIEQRLGARNVGAFAHYLVDVAAVLARDPAPGSADSARRILARAKAAVPADAHAALRDELLVLEAAVRYRLGDRGRADSLFAEFRARDSLKAEHLAGRRMLRDYVSRRR